MAHVSMDLEIAGDLGWALPAWLRRLLAFATTRRGEGEDGPETDDRRDFFLEMLDCGAFQSEADFHEAMTVYPGRF